MDDFIKKCAAAAEKALKAVLAWEKLRIPERVAELEKVVFREKQPGGAVWPEALPPQMQEAAVEGFHDGVFTKVSHNNGKEMYTAEIMFVDSGMHAAVRVDSGIRFMAELAELKKKYRVRDVHLEFKQL